MLYRNYLLIFIFFIFTNCKTVNLQLNDTNTTLEKNFSNKGFALIYNDDFYNKSIVSRKMDIRSLVIFQKNLKKGTQVKITNNLNNRSLIAIVGADSEYPSFNNSVVSSRIAEVLDLNVNEPYIEIKSITKNSLFVAKKAKTFDEEKNVANKVPVNTISISNLNKKINKKKKNSSIKFRYFIKIADFYYKETATIMINRIKTKTEIKNPKIKKLSKKKYRVYLGPFNEINSLQKSYNDISILKFENIEITRND